MSDEIEPEAGDELAVRPVAITGFKWNPQLLAAPKVRPELTKLDAVTRSAEVIGYSARTAEYWLSPDGRLREWFRLCLFISVVLGIPVVLLVPVVTVVLTSVATWVALLLQIVEGLAIIAGCIVGISLALRYFNESKGNHRPCERDRHRHS